MSDRASDGLVIRTGTLADIDPVLALWEVAAAASSNVSDHPEGLRRLLTRDPEALIVAELAGRSVGTLIVGWDGWRGTLYRLAVDPAARRRGIARRLVAEGERRLRALGAWRVGALVLHEDDRATSFWPAVGYEHDERIVRFVKELDEV